MNTQSHATRLADYTGMLSALLCLVHCLTIPALALIFGMTQIYLPHELSDVLFVVLSLVSAAIVARRSSRRFRLVLMILIVAMIGAFWLKHAMHDPVWLDYLGYTGSLGLAVTHFIHLKTCKNDACSPNS